MERIYATLEDLRIQEEQLPSEIQNKINKIEILTDKYNSRCDLLDEIEDQESENYKKLDQECEQLDAEIDAMEENIVESIKNFAQTKNNPHPQPQMVAANGAQTQGQQMASQEKKKSSNAFWIFAGVVAVITLGTVVLKAD